MKYCDKETIEGSVQMKVKFCPFRFTIAKGPLFGRATGLRYNFGQLCILWLKFKVFGFEKIYFLVKIFISGQTFEFCLLSLSKIGEDIVECSSILG